MTMLRKYVGINFGVINEVTVKRLAVPLFFHLLLQRRM